MKRSTVIVFIGWSIAILSFGQSSALRTDNSSSSLMGSINMEERQKWFIKNTVGPPSLVGGVISSAWGTLFNAPEEYGPHWDGFAKRYGMRLTGVATGNAIEASLGMLWGEDPRYPRAAGQPFKSRVGQIVKMTFLARSDDGKNHLAYARYVAVTGSNYLSNTWRADSEATTGKATVRVGLGFVGRMAGNAFLEFWPDVKERWLTRK